MCYNGVTGCYTAANEKGNTVAQRWFRTETSRAKRYHAIKSRQQRENGTGYYVAYCGTSEKIMDVPEIPTETPPTNPRQICARCEKAVKALDVDIDGEYNGQIR